MKKLAVCVLLSACLVGGQCYGYTAWGGYQGLATYVPESDEVLAPKPDDYEVVVFVRGDEPGSTYRVIGRVYFDNRTYPGLSTRRNKYTDIAVSVLDVLKDEARNQGADALVDFNLELGGNYAIGRAKAVVFE